MEAQRYRHRVHLQEKVEVRNPVTGSVTHSWQTFYIDGNSDSPADELPAEVLTGPGKEPIAADAKQSETAARITMPWFPGLLPTMRILWDGFVYDITSIELDRTARMQYRVTCKDGLTDGE